MKLADFNPANLKDCLRDNGICFSSGPFRFHIRSDLPEFVRLLWQMYADYPLVSNEFADFHIDLVSHRPYSRFLRPQIQFYLNEAAPFEPFPRDTPLPFLEWGLNWCVAMNAHHYLMLHAGVLEKNGNVLILPAHPGSGKSTLCVALCHRDWRVLTDEIALVRPTDQAIVPFPRLMPLKNESIEVFRNFAPEAVLGPEYPKTRKGTVCHVRPPTDSIERSNEIGYARWIVLPQFKAGASLSLQPLDKTQAFIQLTGHSFNYELIGLRGFKTMTALVDACDCYTFEYGGDLEQAVAQLNALADGLI